MELDEQSGISVSQGGKHSGRLGSRETVGGFGYERQEINRPSDAGGASRFFAQSEYDEPDFPPFVYQAKAGKKERNQGVIGQNQHPTVKPVSLMRYLIKLVTPKGGVVFDPFLGSGTTAVASVLEGNQWVGCELTEEYWQIIEARVAWANEEFAKTTPTLF